MSSSEQPATDHVDQILAQWQRERPDLDAWPMAPFGRMYRLFHHLSGAIEQVHRDAGLTTGEFDVLATLRRSGAPYRLTPTQLLATAMLTSGAMTNRLNRLEQRGLVERIADDADRRSLLVQLTDEGLRLIGDLVVRHLEKERELLNLLKEDDQRQIDTLLRRWLMAFE